MFSVDGVAGFVPGVVTIPVDVLPTSLSVHGDWTTRLADLRPYRERNPLRNIDSSETADKDGRRVGRSRFAVGVNSKLTGVRVNL